MKDAPNRPKRFYKKVSHKQTAEGYHISLDDKAIITPSGQVFMAPNRDIAAAICKEWEAQDTYIMPQTMHITQIINTCIDRVTPNRAEIEAEILGYVDTDLICYRAPNEPATKDHADAQSKSWDTWCNWFNLIAGVRLKKTEGLTAIKQSKKTHDFFKKCIKDFSDLELTLFSLLNSMGGSPILALAFMEEAIAPVNFFNTIHVDDHVKASLYQEEFYGAAPNEEKKQEAEKEDLYAFSFVLESLYK